MTETAVGRSRSSPPKAPLSFKPLQSTVTGHRSYPHRHLDTENLNRNERPGGATEPIPPFLIPTPYLTVSSNGKSDLPRRCFSVVKLNMGSQTRSGLLTMVTDSNIVRFTPHGIHPMLFLGGRGCPASRPTLTPNIFAEGTDQKLDLVGLPAPLRTKSVLLTSHQE